MPLVSGQVMLDLPALMTAAAAATRISTPPGRLHENAGEPVRWCDGLGRLAA